MRACSVFLIRNFGNLMTQQQKQYDIVIIGGGISGAAQAYALAQYTDVKRVALIEKEPEAGSVNTHATNNSQTLHEGDIETNYTIEKARAVQHKAWFTRSYLERKRDASLYEKGPKMVLGVGAHEVQFLEERFSAFKEDFPTLEKIGAAALAIREPHIMAGRSVEEEIIALYNPDGITVNYGKLATTLLNDARAQFARDPSRTLDVFLGSSVQDIMKSDGGYVVAANTVTLGARFLSVAAGAHSMYFAKRMGIDAAKHLSLMLVAGNFYYTPKLLTSKVYTVQNPKLPFSAVHGDPDILHDDLTRYGPTTRLVMTLERHRLGTVLDFFTTIRPFVKTLLANLRIVLDPDLLLYVIRHNVLFPMPIVGRWLFAREIKKIIPLLDTRTVTLARGQGGVRPQIIDTASPTPLNFGDAKLRAPNALFNITPSPGATTGMYNGLVDVEGMAKALGARFFASQVESDFGRALR